MSTIIASNLQASGGTGTAATLASINGGPISGARNRIINGDMRISQRGTSVTIVGASGTTNGYAVDRFMVDIGAASGQATVTQSTDVPSGQGFVNSILYTVNTARTMAATDYTYIRQSVEGFNFADAMYGTANARQFTLSFWVKSSLTGTFGMYFGSASNARMVSATYTINSANTWEFKTIAIPVDSAVSASWLTNNGVGLQIAWSLGCGSTYRAAAGSWQSSLVLGATGQVDVIATAGATFYLTGVQLEAGTVATPFERRSYGQELELCQRYYYNVGGNGTANGRTLALGFYFNNTQVQAGVTFPVTMRATPTVSSIGTSDAYTIYRAGSNDTFTGWTDSLSSVNYGDIYAATGVSGTGGNAGVVATNNASAFLAFSAEL